MQRVKNLKQKRSDMQKMNNILGFQKVYHMCNWNNIEHPNWKRNKITSVCR